MAAAGTATSLQMVAGVLLAVLSGGASAITRVRYKLFASAQSGNQILLAISLAKADWPWVGVYATVVGLYTLGAALGFLYTRVESKCLRGLFALALSIVFVLIDVVLVEAIPGADSALRSLVVACIAVPLGALFAISNHGIGLPASAQTGNLVRSAELAARRLWTNWRRAVDTEGADGAFTRQDLLALLLPVLFTLGGVAGVELEKRAQYALAALSPGFAIGIYVADLASVGPRIPTPSPDARPLAATTGERLRFVLAL